MRGKSEDQVLCLIQFTLGLFDWLGLILNMRKSTLIPTQKIEFLVALLESEFEGLSPTTATANNLSFVSVPQMSAFNYISCMLEVSRPSGYVIYIVQDARLQLHPLQNWLKLVYLLNCESLNSLVRVPPKALESLESLTDQSNVRKDVSVALSPLIRTIVTDVLTIGWGECQETSKVQGFWTELETSLQISVLELQAIYNLC